VERTRGRSRPWLRNVIEAVLTADRKPDGARRQDNVMRYVIADKPE
jgi:hypothetical protein